MATQIKVLAADCFYSYIPSGKKRKVQAVLKGVLAHRIHGRIIDQTGVCGPNPEMYSTIDIVDRVGSPYEVTRYIPDEREQAQLDSPSCDANFDSMTGQMFWSAR